MKKFAPELVELLEVYADGRIEFNEFRDYLPLQLQTILENSSDGGRNLLYEVLACVYEIEDGVMDEDEFRRAVAAFLENPASASTRKNRIPKHQYINRTTARKVGARLRARGRRRLTRRGIARASQSVPSISSFHKVRMFSRRSRAYLTAH